MFEDLLREADLSLNHGDFYKSLDLLRQAHELKPDNLEIANRYSELQQRRNLEEQLRQIETDCTSKIQTGSMAAAHNVLGRGLNLLLEYLPSGNKQALNGILQAGRSLIADDQWEIAQGLLLELGRSGFEHWASLRTYTLANQWLELGRDIALMGIIASERALGNYVEAYRASRSYLYRNPTSEEAIRISAKTREMLYSHLNRSATKRLERAREAIQQEEFQLAIDNLYDLDSFYKKVEEEFPYEFRGDEDVEHIRLLAGKLKEEAVGLQTIQRATLSQLVEVEGLFSQNRLEEAERKLLEIRDVPLNDLSKRTKDLFELIRKTRIDKARHTFQREITSVQAGLGTLTLQELNTILGRLRELPDRIDWHLLHDEDRLDYEHTLDQVYRKLQIQSLFEQAQASIKTEGYEKAHAILASIPTQGNPEAQALLRQIEQGLERQRREKLEQSIQKLLERAKDDFRHKRFLTAQRTLHELSGILERIPEEHRMLWRVQIQTLGDEIKIASEIWSLYSQAQAHIWEGQKEGETGNLREANALLDQVIGNSDSNEAIQEIQEQARELMDSILMGTYMMDGNLNEVEKRLIAKMMVEPTNVNIRLNLIQIRATKDIEELAKQIKMESRLWFWATMISTIVAFVVFVIAIVFALRENTVFASLTLLVTVLTGFLAKAFSDQYQQANQRADRKLETKLEGFIKQQADEVEKIGKSPTTI